MRYSRTFQDHFMNPRNVGEMEEACGKGEAIQEKDGDHVSVFVNLEGDRVTMRYLVKGCPRIIASSSALRSSSSALSVPVFSGDAVCSNCSNWSVSATMTTSPPEYLDDLHPA